MKNTSHMSYNSKWIRINIIERKYDKKNQITIVYSLLSIACTTSYLFYVDRRSWGG